MQVGISHQIPSHTYHAPIVAHFPVGHSSMTGLLPGAAGAFDPPSDHKFTTPFRIMIIIIIVGIGTQGDFEVRTLNLRTSHAYKKVSWSDPEGIG